MKKQFIHIILLSFLTVNTYGSVSLILPDSTGKSGTHITIPVVVKNFQNIISIQGTIQFDPSIISFDSIQQFSLPGLNAANFGTTLVNSGVLTFLWFDGALTGQTVADSTVIFSITFNITGTNGQVSPLEFVDSPTLLEIADSSFTVVAIDIVNGSIQVQNPLSTGHELILDNTIEPMLLQNIPNPFSGSTAIGFTLPVESDATISVYNISGEKVWEGKGEYQAGKQIITWSSDFVGQALSNGMYYYQLQSGDFSTVKKMILIK